METELDFYLLPDTDRNKLIIIDASRYGEPADSPILSITLPGFKKPISIPFLPERVNIISTSLLGTSPLGEFKDFGDGIYTFTYSICPNDQQQKTRFYLLDRVLQDKLSEKQLASLDNATPQLIAKLTQIDIFLQAAKIQAAEGNPYMATDWYNRANYLIDKLKC